MLWASCPRGARADHQMRQNMENCGSYSLHLSQGTRAEWWDIPNIEN